MSRWIGAIALLATVTLDGCHSRPTPYYPAIRIAAGAVVDRTCPSIQPPPTWQTIDVASGVTMSLPAATHLLFRRDAAHSLQTWGIDSPRAGVNGTQLLVGVWRFNELRGTSDTIDIPIGTPRALVCRMRVASGVAQVVASGERPGYLDQRPLMFSAWLPAADGAMISLQGEGGDPELRDTLFAVLVSLHVKGTSATLPRPLPAQ